MAELTPPGFENMVRPPNAFRSKRLTRDLYSGHHMFGPLVLWIVRIIEPCIIHDWAECDPSNHQQHRRQLERLPFSLRTLRRSEPCDLVRCVPRIPHKLPAFETSVTGVDVPTGRRDAMAWADKHRANAETYVPDDDESASSKRSE